MEKRYTPLVQASVTRTGLPHINPVPYHTPGLPALVIDMLIPATHPQLPESLNVAVMLSGSGQHCGGGATPQFVHVATWAGLPLAPVLLFTCTVTAPSVEIGLSRVRTKLVDVPPGLT